MTRNTDISLLFKGAKEIKYNRGELIIRGDDEPQGVHLIENGFVKAVSVNEHSEYIHLIFTKGDIFPLSWSIDGLSREINFKAITPAVVKRIARDHFLDNLYTNPPAYEVFLQYVVYVMRTYSDRVENLRYKYASDRVIYRLLYLGSRFGIKKGQQILIELPVTHRDLASSLSLSTKSVSRELARLRRKKLISETSYKINILDYKKLNSELKTNIGDHIIKLLNDM